MIMVIKTSAMTSIAFSKASAITGSHWTRETYFGIKQLQFRKVNNGVPEGQARPVGLSLPSCA